MAVVVPNMLNIGYSVSLLQVTEILSGTTAWVTRIIRNVSYENRMRCACSFVWIYAGNEASVPVTTAAVIIGFIPDYDAVLSPNGEATAIIVMSDVVANDSIRRPHFKPIH